MFGRNSVLNKANQQFGSGPPHKNEKEKSDNERYKSKSEQRKFTPIEDPMDKVPQWVRDSDPKPAPKIAMSIGGEAFDATKMYAIHHETTMVACLFLIQRQKDGTLDVLSFVNAFKLGYSHHGGNFKVKLDHVIMVAYYLEESGINPRIQYAESKSKSEDKFFKSLLVENSFCGVNYFMVTPDEVEHATIETTESIFVEGRDPVYLSDDYSEVVNDYLIDQLNLPADSTPNDVSEVVERIVAAKSPMPPTENTSFSIADTYPGLLGTDPVPRGSLGDLTLAVKEVDRLIGADSTVYLVRDSNYQSTADPYRPNAYPAARIVPMGTHDRNPSMAFCSFVDTFQRVRQSFLHLSEKYDNADTFYREESTVLNRLTGPYVEARETFLDNPYGYVRSKYVTFYQSGISSAKELKENTRYLHITNMSTYTTAVKDGYVGRGFVIDPRRFIVLAISREMYDVLGIKTSGQSVVVPIATKNKASTLSMVTSYASVAILVDAYYPDSGYGQRIKRIVISRGPDYVEYYQALLDRFSFLGTDRKVLVGIPWYKYKKYKRFVPSDIFDEAAGVEEDPIYMDREQWSDDSDDEPDGSPPDKTEGGKTDASPPPKKERAPPEKKADKKPKKGAREKEETRDPPETVPPPTTKLVD